MKKIAIIHDSIRYFGGAERVLVGLHSVWPNADIYTSTVSWEHLGPNEQIIRAMHPKTSWAQQFSWFRHYPWLYRYMLPLIWWSFDLSRYDLVITSSHAQMSHLVRVPEKKVHVDYILSPPRHLYGFITDFNWQQFSVVRFVASLGNILLRRLDREAVHRCTTLIACSIEVSKRIARIYKRNSLVIYPPVFLKKHSTKRKVLSNIQTPYLLTVSRVSRAKHVDLIVSACQKLNATLVVVGIGPQLEALKKQCGRNIMFLGAVGDAELSTLYAHAQAVVCASEDEDFGIVPVEAMSFGKPVVAYYSGGHKEIIIDGKTGTFYRKLTEEALIHAIKAMASLQILPKDCIAQSRKFSLEVFQRKIRHAVLDIEQEIERKNSATVANAQLASLRR